MGQNGTEQDRMGWNMTEQDGMGQGTSINTTGLVLKIPLITAHEWQMRITGTVPNDPECLKERVRNGPNITLAHALTACTVLYFRQSLVLLVKEIVAKVEQTILKSR
jgi:hypothetical protein